MLFRSPPTILRQGYGWQAMSSEVLTKEDRQATPGRPTPSVTVPASMPMPPDVPAPEPEGMPLAEGDVAPEKPEKEEAETPAPAEVVEEVIQVDEGEPMTDELDTSLEIEEE